MILKKKYTTKQAVVALVTAGIVLINFLALLFTLVCAHRTKTLSGIDYTYTFENGFTLAFGECPVTLDELQNWLPFYCLLHFIVALALMVFLALHFLLSKKSYFGKLGAFSVIVSFITSLVYMISGILADSVASDFATMYFTSYTVAYLPFIFIVLSVVALILIKLYMPDDFKFGKIKKEKAKKK